MERRRPSLDGVGEHWRSCDANKLIKKHVDADADELKREIEAAEKRAP